MASARVTNNSDQVAELRVGVAHAANPNHLIWEGTASVPAKSTETIEVISVPKDSSNDTNLLLFNDSAVAIQVDPKTVSISDRPYTAEELEEMRAALYASLAEPSLDFRVTPYLQSPSSTSMAINWVSEFPTPGLVTITEAGTDEAFSVESTPVYLDLAEYTEKEIKQEITFNNGNGKTLVLPEGSWLMSNSNYKSEVDLINLKPGTTYNYTVKQGDSEYSDSFTTFPSATDWDTVTLIAFSDTETEPKGRLENREWELHTTNPYAPGSEERPGMGSAWQLKYGHARRNGQDLVRYPLTQYAALNENIRHIEAAEPDALIIAGDLTQGAGYQPAWDEFFRHFAGEESNLAGSTPLITALGNWETYAALNGGYGNAAVSRNKYHDYMDTPGDMDNPQYKDSYYRTDIGPVTLITLDSTKGIPTEVANKSTVGEIYGGNDSILKEELWASGGSLEAALAIDPHLTTDTQGSFTWEDYQQMYYEAFEGSTEADVDLPGFNPGTDQWEWAEEQLADAREKGQIILVQFHHAPYSSGVHGMAPNYEIPDNQSGVAMRVYTPLFEKYGVAAVIAGHDEMFERSFVDKNGDGIGFHVYDVGVAADGLRSEKMVKDADGNYVPLNYNTHTQWSATANAPELWETNQNGVKQLVDGGLHYGHLEIRVENTGNGARMTLEPVYIFPILDDNYDLLRTERRVYGDRVVINFDAHGNVIG